MSNFYSILFYTWSDGSFTYSLDPSNATWQFFPDPVDVGTPAGGNPDLAASTRSAWSSVANISFSVNNDDPEIGIYEATLETSNGDELGITYGYSTLGTRVSDLDIFINSSPSVFENPNEREFTYLHELGHALGLQHPNGNGNEAPYTTNQTVMSYNMVNGFNLPLGPMALDIAALQHMYGRLTDTVNTNYDSIFDAESHTPQTIWDNGGSADCIDLSNESDGVTIDLREAVDVNGDWTGDDYHIEVGNQWTFIARGADIENAVGGSDNDIIHGNDARASFNSGAASYGDFNGDNVLWGDGAAATPGSYGSDQIYGHGGADIIYGDTGEDTLAGSTSSITGGADQIWGGDGADIIYGEGGSDYLYGEGEGDWIYGGSGDDAIDGGAGIDFIYAGSGNDTIHVNDTALFETIDTGTGADTIYINASLAFGSTNNAYIATIDDADGVLTMVYHQEGVAAQAGVSRNLGNNATPVGPYEIYVGSINDELHIESRSLVGGLWNSNTHVVIDLSQYHLGDSTSDYDIGTLRDYLVGNNLITFSSDNSTVTVNMSGIVGDAGTQAMDANHRVLAGDSGANTYTIMTNLGFSGTILDFSYDEGDAIDITTFDGSVSSLGDLNVADIGGDARITLDGSNVYLNGVTASNIDAS